MWKQIIDLECVSKIVQTLDGMFAKSSNIDKQPAIWALMNTCVTGGSVHDHCLKMIGHISTTKVMGNINVVETCLVENYNDKWIIDSRPTIHVYYSL